MLDYPVVKSGPPRPSQILAPARLLPQSGAERYEVQGAGAILVPVHAGDRVTVVNAEGGQVAELVAADRQGRIDAGIIGGASNSDARGLKALLAAGRGAGLGGLLLPFAGIKLIDIVITTLGLA